MATIAATWVSARQIFFDGARAVRTALLVCLLIRSAAAWGAGRHVRAEPGADGQRLVVMRLVAAELRGEISSTFEIGEKFIVTVE